MNITVLGTGKVGRALAGRLDELGHGVVIGTRDPDATLARDGVDSFAEWLQHHESVGLQPYRDAALAADVIVNAVAGVRSLDALRTIGAEVLADKVLLDLAIPLDLSQGLPPTLTIAGTDSLGEQIQHAFPRTRVVKSLHTVYFEVMIDPRRVPGHHNIFVAGNDSAAKRTVREILTGFGWPAEDIIDLGGVEAARATEMYSQLFFALHAQLESFDFNISLQRR